MAIINGTPGNDQLEGTDGIDTINALGGDDEVNGNKGDDIAFLGDGNDVFGWVPGDGSDFVDGGAGLDTLDFDGANADENIQIFANAGKAIRAAHLLNHLFMLLSTLNHEDHEDLEGREISWSRVLRGHRDLRG